MTVPSETIHASAVAVAGRGVVVRGRSGSGKSSLVLSLLMNTAATTLIADDRVLLSARGGRVFAVVPEALAGQIEVRGLGILRQTYMSPVAVHLVVDLLPQSECPRMPAPDELATALAGVAIPRIFIAEGAVDAPSRVLAALAAFQNNSLI